MCCLYCTCIRRLLPLSPLSYLHTYFRFGEPEKRFRTFSLHFPRHRRAHDIWVLVKLWQMSLHSISLADSPPVFLSHPPAKRSSPGTHINSYAVCIRQIDAVAPKQCIPPFISFSMYGMQPYPNFLALVSGWRALARFELDEERASPTRSGDGVNHVTASLGDGSRLDGYVVVSTTSALCGRQTLETIEARQLVDGGRSHIQVPGT